MTSVFAPPTRRSAFALVAVTLLLPGSLFPQAAPAPAAAKRPLTHADYDSWRSITNQKLSADGRYLVYALFPQEGDGELVVRDLQSGKEIKEPVGMRPAPAAPEFGAEPGASEPQAVQRGISVFFTADSRTVVATTLPSKAETEQARKEKKTGDAAPKNGLLIIDLAAGKTVRVDRVKSVQVPDQGNGVIAYLKEPPIPQRGEAAPARRGPRGVAGSDLVLRWLADGTERVIPEATEFTLTKDAALVAYAVSSRANQEQNGVFLVQARPGSTPVTLVQAKSRFSRLTWDEPQRHLAFVTAREEGNASQLYLAERTSTAAQKLNLPESLLPKEMALADQAPLSFSRDGERLFFGYAPAPPQERRAEGDNEEKPVFDLWHWKDDFVQPMQKVRARAERTRSYRAAYLLPQKKFVVLSDRTMPELTPSADGRFAIGGDDREYRSMVEYDTRYIDSYLVDVANGTRKLLTKKHQGSISWSPDGKYALMFSGRNWNTISVPDGTVRNISRPLGVNFYNEENDEPAEPPAYGIAGWTRDGKHVILYDHFDLWQVAADGSGAKNLTNGQGRRERIIYRYVKLDPEEKSIDIAQPLLLHGQQIESRAEGLFRVRPGNAALEKLTWADRKITPPVKAKQADVYLLTTSTFTQFPNLQISDGTFLELRQVSDANPQLAQFTWGTAEHVRFTNADGVSLRANLYKPANFDPSKKYPMLVNIYERLSQNIHTFIEPRPGTSINVAYYVSNGYLVLQPDIVYKVGYPGESAMKCVLPAIQKVVDQGFVDEKSIGIQGHSWGGYQIAYMVTRTNRFKAAAPGALVANMVSAYGGIRWGPGRPRQFQYEHTQSRIGGTLWEYPTRFLENSPIFMADRVQTPILSIANDADDAVPWYQGIEFFMALRRLNKEMYLFNYNGEAHNLRKRINQKDYTVRLQQFFDHYLKGADRPTWMERGIPYIENHPNVPALPTDN